MCNAWVDAELILIICLLFYHGFNQQSLKKKGGEPKSTASVIPVFMLWKSVLIEAICEG